jgi:hypothetical protein
MDGCLLVAHQDVLEFVLLEDGVVDVQHRAAGIAEDVFHALLGQATDQYLSARDGNCCVVTHYVFLSRPIGRLIGCSFLTRYVSRNSAHASLLSAVTSIFRPPVDTFEPALGANSFGVSFCVRNACLSRLWRGLEQTAYM